MCGRLKTTAVCYPASVYVCSPHMQSIWHLQRLLGLSLLRGSVQSLGARLLRHFQVHWISLGGSPWVHFLSLRKRVLWRDRLFPPTPPAHSGQADMGIAVQKGVNGSNRAFTGPRQFWNSAEDMAPGPFLGLWCIFGEGFLIAFQLLLPGSWLFFYNRMLCVFRSSKYFLTLFSGSRWSRHPGLLWLILQITLVILLHKINSLFLCSVFHLIDRTHDSLTYTLGLKIACEHHNLPLSVKVKTVVSAPGEEHNSLCDMHTLL